LIDIKNKSFNNKIIEIFTLFGSTSLVLRPCQNTVNRYIFYNQVVNELQSSSRKSELNLDWNNLWPVSPDQTLNYQNPFFREIKPIKKMYTLFSSLSERLKLMRKVHKGISHESHPPKKVKPLSKDYIRKWKRKRDN
jgi:hypothetical protein